MNKLKIYLAKQKLKKIYNSIKKYIPVLLILLIILILKVFFNSLITSIINLLLTLIILKLIKKDYNSKLTKHDIFTNKIILILFIIYLYLGLILGYSINPMYRDITLFIPGIINYVFILSTTYLIQHTLYNSLKKYNLYILIISIIFYTLFITNIYLIPFIIILELIKLYTLKEKELKGFILEPLLLMLIFVLPLNTNISNELFLTLESLVLGVTTLYYKRLNKITIPNKTIIIKSISLITIILFLSGVFKYNIVVVSSNSMSPNINEGSIAIVEKLGNERHTLNKNEVVLYNKNNKKILHRITEVDKTSSIYRRYILKGDNNKDNDMLSISEEDVLSKYLFNIPLIGYPIVWLENLTGR